VAQASLTNALLGGQAASSKRIDDKYTKNDRDSRPSSHGYRALHRPPVNYCPSSLDADERCNDSRNDEQDAENAYGPWQTGYGRGGNQDNAKTNAQRSRDIESNFG
jgi:hypothetical protein